VAITLIDGQDNPGQQFVLRSAALLSWEGPDASQPASEVVELDALGHRFPPLTQPAASPREALADSPLPWARRAIRARFPPVSAAQACRLIEGSDIPACHQVIESLLGWPRTATTATAALNPTAT
jgi:hypothetical protein